MYTKSNDPSVCSFLRSFFSGRSLLIVCLFIRSAERIGVCHQSLALKNIISPQVELYIKMYWKYIDIEKKNADKNSLPAMHLQQLLQSPPKLRHNGLTS